MTSEEETHERRSLIIYVLLYKVSDMIRNAYRGVLFKNSENVCLSSVSPQCEWGKKKIHTIYYNVGLSVFHSRVTVLHEWIM